MSAPIAEKKLLEMDARDEKLPNGFTVHRDSYRYYEEDTLVRYLDNSNTERIQASIYFKPVFAFGDLTGEHNVMCHLALFIKTPSDDTTWTQAKPGNVVVMKEGVKRRIASQLDKAAKEVDDNFIRKHFQ